MHVTYIAYQSNSKNIIIENYLPGAKIAAKSALMICNGGTASSYQGLSEGTPILAIPCNPDQYYNSTALEINKVGIMLRSCSVNEKNVSAVIKTLLEDKTFKEEALKVKQEMHDFKTLERFKTVIQKFFE